MGGGHILRASLEKRDDCHYHSGLDTGPNGGLPWQAIEKQVIQTMKIVAVVALSLLLTVIPGRAAVAEGDSEAGREIAYSCLGCHGIEGYRNAYPSFRVPKLGGQQAAYLEIALRGYRDGTREHPTMVGQAESLSDQEIADVAAYLSGMSGLDDDAADNSSRPKLDAATPCAACHGEYGVSSNPLWPTLAGQHQDYLLHSLKQYRDGTRKDPVMSAQAALLDEKVLAVMAEYFAGLNGLVTTLPE